MRILAVEGDMMEGDWLRSYMRHYGNDEIEIDTVSSLAEAREKLCEHDLYDLILLSPGISDVLSPEGIPEMVKMAPRVPIVMLVTGKVTHYECIRTPQTWVYHLKTDVSGPVFLQHLRNIVDESHASMPSP